jgi:hypothetical protein
MMIGRARASPDGRVVRRGDAAVFVDVRITGVAVAVPVRAALRNGIAEAIRNGRAVVAVIRNTVVVTPLITPAATEACRVDFAARWRGEFALWPSEPACSQKFPRNPQVDMKGIGFPVRLRG